MSTAGVRFISSVLHSEKLKNWIKHGRLDSLFHSEGEMLLFDFVQGYVSSYGELPSVAITSDETGLSLPKSDGEPGFHFDKLVDRHIVRVLKDSNTKASSLLKGQQDPQQALEVLLEAVMSLKMGVGPHAVTDFRTAYQRVYEDDYLVKLKDPDLKGMSLGWGTLTKLGGGVAGGDVVSIVGRPATGKSFLSLWCGHRLWKEKEVSVAFFTEEMPGLSMEQRLAAMEAGVPLDPIKLSTVMPTAHKKQFKDALDDLQNFPVPFHTIDGRMASTVQDVHMFSSSLGAEVVIIDGAYLLKHPNAKYDRYQRVAENVDAIKRMATDLDVPVICSWQLSREAAKKAKSKEGTEIGLEDIGYSDAIGQHSTIVLALMQEENVSTLQSRKVRVLKGRNGEVGEFTINWDFMHTDFSEIKEAAVEDLQLD